MRIEVIGLPGVGKTTLIHQYMNEICDLYTVIESKKPSLLQRIITKTLYYSYYKRQLNDKSLAKKLAYRHGFQIFNSNNVFLFDSGILQVFIENLIETNFTNIDQKINFISKVPLPEKLLFLHDDIHRIIHREMNRTPRRFKIDFAETKKRYTKAEQIIKTVILKKIDHTQIIDINTPEEFKEALKK